MKDVYLTTAGELADFLEREIAAGRNPRTQEEWADAMARLASEKGAQHLGQTEASSGYIAGSLRDEGINARVLRPKEDADAE